MTEQANSPKARKFEKLAEESRERLESYKAEKGVGDDDPVARFLANSVDQWERRARDIQSRANRRAEQRKRREQGLI